MGHKTMVTDAPMGGGSTGALKRWEQSSNLYRTKNVEKHQICTALKRWEKVQIWFQIADFILQISDFRFQISHLIFQIPDSGFQIADFRLQISDFRFQISHFRLQIPGQGEPGSRGWGNLLAGAGGTRPGDLQSLPFKTLYKNPLEIPKGIPS